MGEASPVFSVSPASCTCFTALVISALSASVSSAVTAAATGTTAGTGRLQGTGTLEGPGWGGIAPPGCGSCPVPRLGVASVRCEAAQTQVLRPWVNCQCLWGLQGLQPHRKGPKYRPTNESPFWKPLKLHLMDKPPFQDRPKAPKLLPRDREGIGSWDPLG